MENNGFCWRPNVWTYRIKRNLWKFIERYFKVQNRSDSTPSYKCSAGLSTNSAGGKNMLRSASKLMSSSTKTPSGFDMGTKWGQAKESRVVEVDFERGCLILSKEIYYASRESLLEWEFR